MRASETRACGTAAATAGETADTATADTATEDAMAARNPSTRMSAFLLPLERLLRRSSEPRSRADELVTLRARFRAQPSARAAGDEAVESATRLRALRVEMSAAFEN